MTTLQRKNVEAYALCSNLLANLVTIQFDSSCVNEKIAATAAIAELLSAQSNATPEDEEYSDE